MAEKNNNAPPTLSAEVVKEDQGDQENHQIVKQEQHLSQRPADAYLANAQDLLTMAEGLAKSKMFPNVKDEYGAMAMIEYGRELGLPPVVALQTMSVVNGKLCVEAKIYQSLLEKAGIRISILKKDKEGCRLKFEKPGKAHEEEFTMKDAERIGLAKKLNYQYYPEEMCYWRCISKGGRVIDPGAVLGLYTKEEMQDTPDVVQESYSEKQKEEKKKEESKKDTKSSSKKTTKKGSTKKKTETKKEEPKEEPQDDEKTELVNEIKQYFEDGFDDGEAMYKQFKRFLSDFQNEKNRDQGKDLCFVLGNQYGHLSMTEGKLDDLKKMWGTKKAQEYTLFNFRKWLREQNETQEGESEDDTPF